MQPMQQLALLLLALAPGLASALSIASPSLSTCQLTNYQTTCSNGPCNIHLRDASTQQDLWTKTNVSSGTYVISWEPDVPAGTSVVAFIYDSSGASANNAATVVNSGSSDCNIQGEDDSSNMGGSGAPYTLNSGNGDNDDSSESSEDSSDSDGGGDSNMNGGQSGNLQHSSSSDGSIHETSATSPSAIPSMGLLASLTVVVVTSVAFGASLLA